MDNERKEEILEVVRKAGSEEYETSWDEKGFPKSKKKSEVRKGRKSKALGGKFESFVRKDLEEKGWIVDKWSNNVDLEEGRVIPAKRKFNPFSKVMSIGTGFPDFVALQFVKEGFYKVIGVEVKVNGTLSREEKEKCRFYLDRKVFSEIWVAEKTKEKNKVRVVYNSAEDILGRMR
ncbi:MAG: hypothetical protein WC494_03835 [Candidatus Pacearchaeota archaeon]